MPIDFTCTCGKSLHAPDGSEGKRARCPKCGSVVSVPVAKVADVNPYDPLSGGATGTSTGISALTSAAMLRSAQPGPSMFRRFAYVFFLLALIPLALSVFLPQEDHSGDILETITNHPELVARAEHGELIENEFMAALFATLPDHRVHGAMLARESKVHWLIALAFAAGYFGLLLVMFEGALKYVKGLLFAGLFTGTAGILLLVIFQFAAYSLPLVIPRGIIGLIILIVKLIGMSYRMADNPENGFLLSFIGFTCGVGLCEEITKTIPLLFRIKPVPGESDTTWNSLMLWGLASGFGFGIAEGIMYSGRYYNGIEGSQIYWVRFLSCVALHAMWAGAVGISVYRQQVHLIEPESNWHYWGRVILVVWVPMVLHGLYDTLLKKEMSGLAMLVALASFAWLALQIERQQRAEPLTAMDGMGKPA